jgi:hypothetical protein
MLRRRVCARGCRSVSTRGREVDQGLGGILVADQNAWSIDDAHLDSLNKMRKGKFWRLRLVNERSCILYT